jgi:hypothetical protein
MTGPGQTHDYLRFYAIQSTKSAKPLRSNEATKQRSNVSERKKAG